MSNGGSRSSDPDTSGSTLRKSAGMAGGTFIRTTEAGSNSAAAAASLDELPNDRGRVELGCGGGHNYVELSVTTLNEIGGETKRTPVCGQRAVNSLGAGYNKDYTE